MSAISDAVDAMFGDETVAKPAIWRAGGAGDGTPCRVTLAQPDAVTGFGRGHAIVATAIVEVRRREIAAPAKDDTVDILDDEESVVETLKILAEATIDSDQEVWSCQAAKV